MSDAVNEQAGAPTGPQPASGETRTGQAGRVVRLIGRIALLVLLGYLLFYAYQVGLLRGTISLFLVLAAAAMLVTGALRLFQRRAALDWIRHPLRADSRLYFAQFLLRALVWIMVGYMATLAVPRALLGSIGTTIVGMIWLSVAVLVLGGLVPLRRISWLADAAFAVAAAILITQVVRVNVPAPGAVAISAPLSGAWTVGSGGRSALLNHYYPLPQQRDALDLLVAFQRSASKPPTALTDFPAYGQPVRSPVDGTVVRAVDGLPDQDIGTTDAEHPAGNNVVLDMGEGRFVLLAQLKPASVEVEVGERVTKGTPIGLVGNSGNTSEPHLYIQIQSGPDLVTADGAPMPGLVTYPITFADATRTRGGTQSQPATNLRTNDLVTFG